MQRRVIVKDLARPCCLLSALCLLGASPATEAATLPVTVQHYALDITLDPVAQSFAGSVDIEFERSSDAAGPIRVDMADTLTAESAVLDGKSVSFTHASDTLAIQAASLSPGTHILIIRYHGRSQGGHHDLQFATDGDGATVTNFGMPYTAKNWWPDLDDPAAKARSMDIRITLPKELTAASNGSLEGVTDLPGGLHQYHWVESYPIYPDVVSIAAGKYQKLDATFTSVGGRTVPIEYYVFKDDVALAKSEFAFVPPVLKVYESLFGPYPFEKEKYGIAEVSVPSFREHQTLPMLGKALMTGSKPVWDLGNVSNVIAHDMAHQWFGNSLTPTSWSDVWLNEGFATYAVALWRERTQGEQAYRDFMGFLDSHDFSGSIHIKDEHDMDSQFTSTTFNKGAWVLHMLRHVMGDADFFSALKSYATDNRYGQVDTAKWRAACEQAYGKPLGWFFDEWIYGEGEPALKNDWSESGGMLKLQVTQTQPGQTFVMPLDVEIVTDTGKSRRTLWLRSRDQTTELPVTGKTQSVVLDPDHWLLKS